MAMYNGYLEGLVNGHLPLSEQTLALLADRLDKAYKRECAIRKRQLFKLIQLYVSDKGDMLRLSSFVCDIWLILFGDRSEL